VAGLLLLPWNHNQGLTEICHTEVQPAHNITDVGEEVHEGVLSSLQDLLAVPSPEARLVQRCG